MTREKAVEISNMVTELESLEQAKDAVIEALDKIEWLANSDYDVILELIDRLIEKRVKELEEL